MCSNVVHHTHLTRIADAQRTRTPPELCADSHRWVRVRVTGCRGTWPCGNRQERGARFIWFALRRTAAARSVRRWAVAASPRVRARRAWAPSSPARRSRCRRRSTSDMAALPVSVPSASPARGAGPRRSPRLGSAALPISPTCSGGRGRRGVLIGPACDTWPVRATAIRSRRTTMGVGTIGPSSHRTCAAIEDERGPLQRGHRGRRTRR